MKHIDIAFDIYPKKYTMITQINLAELKTAACVHFATKLSYRLLPYLPCPPSMTVAMLPFVVLTTQSTQLVAAVFGDTTLAPFKNSTSKVETQISL
jgi:hypothetical protein